jgi:hypothetical protein
VISRKAFVTVGVVFLLGAVLGAVVGYFKARLFNPPATATQPPIKVRGGAMTFRYKAAHVGVSPWLDYPAKAPTGVCVQQDTSTGAKLKIFQHPDQDPDDPGPPGKTFDLATGWVVDLHGRDSAFNPDSLEGVELKAVTDCGGSNGVSVLPIPNSSLSGFYAGALQSSDGSTFAKRYRHSGCSADEDACEHMSTVFVNGTQVADCANGECLVKIVVP